MHVVCVPRIELSQHRLYAAVLTLSVVPAVASRLALAVDQRDLTGGYGLHLGLLLAEQGLGGIPVAHDELILLRRKSSMLPAFPLPLPLGACSLLITRLMLNLDLFCRSGRLLRFVVQHIQLILQLHLVLFMSIVGPHLGLLRQLPLLL